MELKSILFWFLLHSPEDRQKVLEMLKRDHEQMKEDADENDDDDDTPSLSERMEGLNLGR